MIESQHGSQLLLILNVANPFDDSWQLVQFHPGLSFFNQCFDNFFKMEPPKRQSRIVVVWSNIKHQVITRRNSFEQIFHKKNVIFPDWIFQLSDWLKLQHSFRFRLERCVQSSPSHYNFPAIIFSRNSLPKNIWHSVWRGHWVKSVVKGVGGQVLVAIVIVMYKGWGIEYCQT